MDVAISSDGCMAATVSDDYTCRVWDLDDEECLHVMEGHNGWVTSVEFIGTSLELITASHDETARVWDGERGKCLRVLEGHEGRLNKVRGTLIKIFLHPLTPPSSLFLPLFVDGCLLRLTY